jgi:nitroimidazol reductase NimA-like FMN-containing flavoprotein (pyridoxamine 5'-phosphate oxidase superfamily)
MTRAGTSASKEHTAMEEARPVLEKLDEAECLRLISPGGVGRIAFVGSYDLAVFLVDYQLADGAILFRTAQDGLTEEDLRTGIEHGEYRVAFDVDHLDEAAREGWSVLVQGPAHHLDAEDEQEAARAAGVEPWAGGERNHFIGVTPRPRHRPADPEGRVSLAAAPAPVRVPVRHAPSGRAGCASRNRRAAIPRSSPRCSRGLPEPEPALAVPCDCAGDSAGAAGGAFRARADPAGPVAVLHRPAGAGTAGRLHLGRYRAGGRAAGDGL